MSGGGIANETLEIAALNTLANGAQDRLPAYAPVRIGGIGINLVVNPSGERAFHGWEIVKDGGNRMIVERPPIYCNDPSNDFPVAFATSYDWGIKEQTIDLLQCGIPTIVLDRLKPTITVSEWHTCRGDCAAIYRFEATLCTKKRKRLRADDNKTLFEAEVETAQWVGGDWQHVEHRFVDYPVGVRKICVRNAGKDRQFWAGHYGSKMAKTSVIVSFE